MSFPLASNFFVNLAKVRAKSCWVPSWARINPTEQKCSTMFCGEMWSGSMLRPAIVSNKTRNSVIASRIILNFLTEFENSPFYQINKTTDQTFFGSVDRLISTEHKNDHFLASWKLSTILRRAWRGQTNKSNFPIKTSVNKCAWFIRANAFIHCKIMRSLMR